MDWSPSANSTDITTVDHTTRVPVTERVPQDEENPTTVNLPLHLQQHVSGVPEKISPVLSSPSQNTSSTFLPNLLGASSPFQKLLHVMGGGDESDNVSRIQTNLSPQEFKTSNVVKPSVTIKAPTTDGNGSSPTRLGQTSARTVHTGHARQNVSLAQLADSQKLLQKPLDLNREESVALFAKPLPSKDRPMDLYDQESPSFKEKSAAKKVSIHQTGKDGEQSVFEIDYEAGSVFSNNIDPHHAGGFIDGNFSSGKLKEIETSGRCFTIKFNLDSTILAVALSDGYGVELYETQQFRLIYTIERSATVSALDWVDEDGAENLKVSEELDYTDQNEARPQLLAVGGFDGVAKVYSICFGREDLVLLQHTIHLQSAIYSLAFLKDSGTQYAPSPRTIVMGEKTGKLSIVNLAETMDSAKNISNIRLLDMEDSAILSISFGFIQNGIIMVFGTKDGKLRACSLLRDGSDWYISNPLFELERTGAIRALRFNHDSSLLIVGGYDKTVLIIDTQIWKIVRELYVEGTVQDIQYDPYNRYLLLGNRSKVMIIVDTSTIHPIKAFQTSGWVTVS
jgi:hypothetical protein